MLTIIATLRLFDRAILTILSMDAVSNYPLIRYIALISMIFASMSLIYGCIYIVGSAGMCETYRGVEWVQVTLCRIYYILH